MLIEFPKGASLYAPETLDTIAAVHSAVEDQAGVGNVWSLETLRRWLREKAGITDVATLKQYVDILPEHLTRRFISANEDAVVVSGRIPDIDSSRLLPVINQLDKKLDKVRAAHPGYNIAVTGLSVIAARNSANMIGKLNRALTIEIVFVAAFIGLAFRSFIVMCLSILPGIFPIVLSGTLLWAMGDGLNFAAVVALIVSFGLGSQRDDPLPEPAQARRSTGSRPGNRGRAGDRAGRPGADPDVGGAGLRPRCDGPFRPAVAQDLRLAQRLRDACGTRRRSPDSQADGDVPLSPGTAGAAPGGHAGRGIGSRQPSRFSVTFTSVTSIPSGAIVTVWLPPLVVTVTRAVKRRSPLCTIALIRAALALPVTRPLIP